MFTSYSSHSPAAVQPMLQPPPFGSDVTYASTGPLPQLPEWAVSVSKKRLNASPWMRSVVSASLTLELDSCISPPPPHEARVRAPKSSALVRESTRVIGPANRPMVD